MSRVNSAPLARSSATVCSMSSHISEISWCGPIDPLSPLCASAVGWTPSSDGPALKISQPPRASTYSQPTTSRKNARAACAFVGVHQRVNGRDHARQSSRRPSGLGRQRRSILGWLPTCAGAVPPDTRRASGRRRLHARQWSLSVSYTHLRAHETRHDLVCRLLLEKKKLEN